jgi:hypothetical protein
VAKLVQGETRSTPASLVCRRVLGKNVPIDVDTGTGTAADSDGDVELAIGSDEVGCIRWESIDAIIAPPQESPTRTMSDKSSSYFK